MFGVFFLANLNKYCEQKQYIMPKKHCKYIFVAKLKNIIQNVTTVTELIYLLCYSGFDIFIVSIYTIVINITWEVLKMAGKRGRPTVEVRTRTVRLTESEKKFIEFMRVWQVTVDYAARALDNVMELEGRKRNFKDYIEGGV